MTSEFTNKFYEGNRAKLRKLFKNTAPIVVTANGLVQRGADSAYPFAQDANFWYLTGINEPDIILVMEQDKDYLIVPARDSSREAFDGAVERNELTKISGITHIYDEKDGWDQLTTQLHKFKNIATIVPPPAYIKRFGLYTNPARARLKKQIKEINPKLEFFDVGKHLIRMRMIKQPAELQAIQQAIDITTATLKQACRADNLIGYEHEYEIEADISSGFRKRGASGHAFEPIVASGERACTLHNVANNGKLGAGELVVIDIGAEVEHYAADITRTIALGEPSVRQQAVYDAVLDVQQFALSLLKPGVLLKDYEKKIEKYMGDKLRELGLIKTIEHDAVRSYFPHSTSHFLGLNVHDVGDYELPLEAGNVLTVEPGIYIAAEGIGVRIEDDVLITKTGIKILSDKLPRKLI